jgi:histidinol-phosphate aminotransferase
MTINLKKLVNQGVLTLHPYQPGKPIEEVQRELGITDVIKLASNENPLGASPLALKAAQKELANIDRYPDSNGYQLKQTLAHHLGTDPEQITLGNGSDNLLAMAANAFIKPGEEIIISDYAFATFSIIAHLSQAKAVFAQTENWRHDLTAIARLVTKNTKMIFIANPNNPTGTYNTETEFMTFLSAIPENVIIIADEAYHEYVMQPDYPQTLKLLKQFPNLIITRTFSKIYGLAGLRIGYSITTKEMAEILNRVRLPFNVNSVALEAAKAALGDSQHIKESLRVNNEGMNQLSESLHKLGLAFIPSVTNFITINVKQDAIQIFQKLLGQGVIVRPLSTQQMPTHIRVTIGTTEQNQRFISALNKVL